MQNLLDNLAILLAKDQRFVIDGKILKNKVIESALNLDADLLKLLLQNETIKKHFFQQVNDIFVFDKIKFQKFVSNKQFLPDSYTAFKNKIGLISGNDFISDRKEVVLSWPYKDCILEGGQTKEEQKRSEIFWNETLAPDEIDRLLSPKVFTNFKRYTKYGEEENTTLSGNENYIIKGNNLLALHSLTHIKAFNGKIKFIYIDPPYNTGSDSFGYNDNFNHSTWLTFMKNRLDVAKQLLSKEGIICVQCSFHEYGYLKIVMDEIFPKFLCTFNIQVRHPDRILTGDKEYNDIIEYTLIYSNNPAGKMPKRIETKTNEEYIFQVSEIGSPEVVYFDSKKIEIFTPDKYKVSICKPGSENTKKISVRGSIREKNSSGRLYVKHIEPIASNYPAETLFKVENMGDDSFGYRYFYTPPKGNKNGGYFQGKPQSSDVTEKPFANYYNFEKEYNNVANEGNVDFRNGKKPEQYIAFLIDIFTKENDWVLDYHLGSGTTSAVAHKKKRRYIGVEQMDYIQTKIVERLKSVINGEQSGISQSINWQGGGDFIYCELNSSNDYYINLVLNSRTELELIKLFELFNQLPNLNILFSNVTLDDFSNLTVKAKQSFLIDILDKNQLYINLSEINDADYKISDKEKLLNQQIYNLK